MLKTILSNTAAQLVAKAVGVGLTFLTTVLIIRLAGPSLFGDLTKALSLIAIGFTAIDFGLNAVAVRSMKGEVKKQQQILAGTLLTRIFLSLLVIILVNLVVYLLPGGYTPAIKSVFWVGSLAIFFQGVYTSMNIWFQRHLSYWKTTVATVAGTVVGTLLTYLSIKTSPTLFNLLAASSIGYFVMGVATLALGPHLSLRLPHNSFFIILNSLKKSLPLGIILVFSILASKLDSIILGVYRSSAEVGQYGFAYRIFEVILVLPVFVMNAVYPLLLDNIPAQKVKLINNSLLSLLILACLGVGGIWFFAPYLSLIRPDMELSVQSLRLLGLSLPLFYVTAPLMWQLIEGRLEKYLLVVYGLAALFNGISNLILVPRFGALASALLTAATEALILAGLLLIKKSKYVYS